MLPTTTITITTLYLDPEQLIPFIKTHNIQKIKYHSSILSSSTQNLLLHHPSIILTNIKINISTYFSLSPILQSNPTTQLIHIQNCSFNFSYMDDFTLKTFKIIQTHANLTTLTLKYPPKSIINSIQIFKKLKSLTIINTRLSSLSPSSLALHPHTHLTYLDLKNLPIKNINHLIHPPTLKRLIIQDTPIENIDPIKECYNLISLILTNTQITHIPHINSSNLKKLIISESPIPDLSFIQFYTHLTHLTLHNILSSITSLTIPHSLTDLALIFTNINNITTINPKSTYKHHALFIKQNIFPSFSPSISNSCTHLKLQSVPITHLKHFPSITHLTLTKYYDPDISFISNSCKKLNKLTIIDSTCYKNKYLFDDSSHIIIEKYYNQTLQQLHFLRYNYVTPLYNNHFHTIKTLELNNLTIPSLNFLNLCTNLRYLIIENYHPLNFHTLNPNPNIDTITLTNCPHLTSIQPIITYAPNIHTLTISQCNNLHDITTQTSKFLTSLSITHCDKLIDASALNIKTLIKLNLNNCQNLKRIPTPKFTIFKKILNHHFMPKLESLDLSYCIGLNNIKTILSYKKLNRINISHCINLQFIPHLNDNVEIIC